MKIFIYFLIYLYKINASTSSDNVSISDDNKKIIKNHEVASKRSLELPVGNVNSSNDNIELEQNIKSMSENIINIISENDLELNNDLELENVKYNFTSDNLDKSELKYNFLLENYLNISSDINQEINYDQTTENNLIDRNISENNPVLQNVDQTNDILNNSTISLRDVLFFPFELIFIFFGLISIVFCQTLLILIIIVVFLIQFANRIFPFLQITRFTRFLQ